MSEPASSGGPLVLPAPPSGPSSGPDRPGRLRRWAKRAGTALLLLILLIPAALAGGLAWLRSDSGRQRLQETANAALGPALEPTGLSVRLGPIGGPLPFGLTASAEVADAGGTWLKLPDLALALDWKDGEIRIEEIRARGAELLRLPDLPPAPPDPPEPHVPLEKLLEDTRQALASLGGKLSDLGGVPPVRLSRLEADIRMPASLAGLAPESPDAPPITLRLQGAARAALGADTAAEAEFSLNADLPDAGGPEEGAMHALGPTTAEIVLSLKAGVDAETWKLSLDGTRLSADAGKIGSMLLNLSGGPGISPQREGWLDDPLNLAWDLAFTPHHAPDAQPEAVTAPVTLSGGLSGSLAAPAIAVSVEAPRLRGIASAATPPLDDLRLAISAGPARWRDLLLGGAASLGANMRASFASGGHEVSARIGVEAESPETPPNGAAGERDVIPPLERTWRAGIRELDARAPGADASGSWSADLATLPDLLAALQADDAARKLVSAPQEILKFLPSMRGRIVAEVRDWKALGALLSALAGTTLPCSGREVEAILAAADDGGRQDAGLSVSAPSVRLPGDVRVDGAVLDLRLEDLRGRAGVSLKGDVADVRVPGFHVAGSGLKIAGEIPRSISLSLNARGDAVVGMDAEWRPGRLEVRRLDAALKSPSLGVHAAPGAVLRYDHEALAAGRPPLETDLAFSGWRLDVRPSGRVLLDGSVSVERLQTKLKVESLALAPWRALVPGLPGGEAALSADLGGSMRRPTGTFRAEARGIRLDDVKGLPALGAVLDGSLSAAGTRAKLELTPETLRALGGEKADILTASLPPVRPLEAAPVNLKAPLDARIRWSGLLAPLWKLVPMPDSRLTGRLLADVHVTGSAEAPNIAARISVADGRFVETAQGAELRDINLKAELRPGSGPTLPERLGTAVISGSLGDGRKGSLKIDGEVALAAERLRVAAILDRLRPLRRPDLFISLSGRAGVEGTFAAPAVSADITIDEGVLTLNRLSVPGGVTTLPVEEKGAAKKPAKTPAGASAKAAGGRTGKGAGKAGGNPGDGGVKAAPAGAGPHLRAAIRTPPLRGFRVRGFGLDSEWAVGLRAEGPADAPMLGGDVKAMRGALNLLGKDFTLSKGTVSFLGGDASRPHLNMALSRNTGKITATVAVTGPPSRLALKLGSDPAIPEEEIVSQMLFGKESKDLGRWESLQLAASVARLAGFGGDDDITDTARNVTGLDVIRVGSRAGRNEGEEEVTLEAGKFIGEKIYVGVEQGASGAAGLAEIELLPGLKLQGRSDQKGGRGGVRWKISY